jgi:hypothetical protein
MVRIGKLRRIKRSSEQDGFLFLNKRNLREEVYYGTTPGSA